MLTRESANFQADLRDGETNLSGADLNHFRSRVTKAAHILAELMDAGVNPSATLKILFAGSGVGFIPYILARHTRWQIFAGDLDEGFLTKFPFVRERLRVCRLDATALPFSDDCFDILVYNHVVEHVLNWEALASEAFRIVKPSGMLYLATPNLHGFYRPDVPWKVFFGKLIFRKNRNVARECRVFFHMGLSWFEVKGLVKEFKNVNVLNRAHVMINCPKFFKLMAVMIPDFVYRRFAPNHVILARK